MDNIKIAGGDKRCVISGENFSYTFENGHPTVLVRDGKKLEPFPHPDHNGRKMKSHTKLINKYWDSVLVITRYTFAFGLESIEIKYHVQSDGEIKKECIY